MRTERSACSCPQLNLFLVSQKHPSWVQAYIKGKLRLRYSPACQSMGGSAGASGLKGLPPVYPLRALGLTTVSLSDDVMNPPQAKLKSSVHSLSLCPCMSLTQSSSLTWAQLCILPESEGLRINPAA